MKTKQKKHRTLIPGVTVEVNPSGSFTVTANRRHRVRWEAIPRELRRHIKARLAEAEPKPRFKVWTKGNRGRYFDTLEAATAAAEEVRKQTGFILLITQEKGRP